MSILAPYSRGDNTDFVRGKSGFIVLFVQKVQKRRSKADKHDDIPFNNNGWWFLFGRKYGILSPSGEEKTFLIKKKYRIKEVYYDKGRNLKGRNFKAA